MHLTRRQVVLGAAAAGFGTARASAPAAAAARLRRIVPDAASARTIARAWLGSDPGAADRAMLEARLLDALALDRGGLAALGEAALRARASLRVRADFAAGRTVSLDGWILARTEVLLCTLSASR
jgi:hypothetical protein